MRHTYLYGLAVDSGDPQVVIVSASVGPGRLTRLKTLSRLYIEEIKTAKNGRPFQMDFLDQVTLLAVNPKAKGEFYAANNRGLFIEKLTFIGRKNTTYNPPWS